MSKYSAIFDNEEDALLYEQARKALMNDDEETFYELMTKVPLDPHALYWGLLWNENVPSQDPT